jgi:hypothetical protein
VKRFAVLKVLQAPITHACNSIRYRSNRTAECPWCRRSICRSRTLRPIRMPSAKQFLTGLVDDTPSRPPRARSVWLGLHFCLTYPYSDNPHFLSSPRCSIATKTSRARGPLRRPSMVGPPPPSPHVQQWGGGCHCCISGRASSRNPLVICDASLHPTMRCRLVPIQ